MVLDIHAALAAVPVSGTKLCKLAKVLQGIPEETPGKADLLAAVANPEDFSGRRLSVVLSSLGLPVARTTIDDHRSQTCRCYRS